MISQLNQDINYCTRVLGCNAKQTDELISAAATLNLNVQYFVEEFIFTCENVMKYHDDDVLNLDAFNAYHGIYFEDV